MKSNSIDEIEFAGNVVRLVREAEVQSHLSLDDALVDLRIALEDLARQQAVNCVRTRVESRQHETAWLHTLRGGLSRWGVAGGKDYTSLMFDTPAMWATVVDTKRGLLIAFMEAEYLSRVRTAATTAIATDLLAPANADSLAHFGAGKISELLVKAILKVRPSINRVFLVRKDISRGAPHWFRELEGQMEAKVVDANQALIEADLITTATNSRTPVIPPQAPIPRLHHLNLIGSNHLKRREISDDLARRCVPPEGYLAVDDKNQAKLEAGDFVAFEQSRELIWDDVPTLAQLLVDPTEKQKASKATLTTFKSVGIGLMDLALATGVLRRMGALSDLPYEGG